jgi:hypothetical protein
MKKPRTNRVILSSIPLNRKLKRYWESKYERIRTNCGDAEAERKFKALRVAILNYLSDANRKANLSVYLSMTGFRQNGMLKRLFEYSESMPHAVLNFLKLYTAPGSPAKTVDQAAIDLHKRLESVKACEALPTFLRSWLECVSTSHAASWKRARRLASHPMHRMAVHLSYDEWHQYWLHWFCILRAGWQSKLQLDYKQVFPEIYKDYDARLMDSKSYTADVADLVSMHVALGTVDPFGFGNVCPLSEEELQFVDGFLDQDVASALKAYLQGEEPEISIFDGVSFLSGQYVGHNQHLPKKGSGVDYRDIAVPNRFIQAALEPGAAKLYNVVSKLPHDATFNQDKFDQRIQNRVNNSDLYQGSVDLSKATDNLPRSWGFYIVETLLDMFGYPSDPFKQVMLAATGKEDSSEIEVWKSLKLFQTISNAKWEDEGFLNGYKVGQPLGSLPSFALLAITHNLFLESLAAHLGLVHSPYFVLGDDVVITNRKLRSRYIRELTSRAIPLSLHKSYEGRLSEFAGKTFIKGCIPFYCSDHSPLTWESLFDWQRSTGIRIPWDHLPRAIQRRIKELARRCLLDSGYEQPSRHHVTELAISSYHLTLECEVLGRGSHPYPLRDSAEQTDLTTDYYFEFYSRDESPQPEAVKHSGITLLAGRYPITLMGERFADHDGFFHRFRPVQLPDWYKEKFRPCATQVVLECAVKAMLRSEHHDETPSGLPETN